MQIYYEQNETHEDPAAATSNPELTRYYQNVPSSLRKQVTEDTQAQQPGSLSATPNPELPPPKYHQKKSQNVPSSPGMQATVKNNQNTNKFFFEDPQAHQPKSVSATSNPEPPSLKYYQSELQNVPSSLGMQATVKNNENTNKFFSEDPQAPEPPSSPKYYQNDLQNVPSSLGMQATVKNNENTNKFFYEDPQTHQPKSAAATSNPEPFSSPKYYQNESQNVPSSLGTDPEPPPYHENEWQNVPSSSGMQDSQAQQPVSGSATSKPEPPLSPKYYKSENKNVSSSFHIKEFFAKNWKSVVVIMALPLAFFYGFFNPNNVPVGICYELCKFPLSQFLLPCDQIITYDFVSFKKEQENLFENLQKNAKEFNPPNDKSLSLRVKDIEMVSRDFITVIEYSDLSHENKFKLVDKLNEFADESYVVVDRIIDLDVTTSMTIRSVSEYIEETSRALEKLNDDSLNLKQLKELNETYEAIMGEHNSQLKELGSKAVEAKTRLKKMGSLQYEMFKIVTKEKKYQKDQREYHEGTFLSGIWKFFRNDVRSREFEENLEILQKFEKDKVKAVATINEIEQSVDKYQRNLEKLRNRVGKILFTRISVQDHIGLLLSFFGFKGFKSIEKE